MLEIKDEVKTTDETTVETDTKPAEAKTFQCNASVHEGDRTVKLGFNFRELRSRKNDAGVYVDKQFWYNNLCKPCGQKILLEAQKA